MLELRKVFLSDEFYEKYNEISRDFLQLFKDGKRVRDVLYRKGTGCGELEDPYFLLIKYSEDYYDDHVTKDPKKKLHLKEEWCILDRNGNEKVIFDQFKVPCLQGGLIYVIDHRYYNIETGKLYCESYSSMESEIYLFIENKYDKDKSKRGVLKINKLDGSVELFKDEEKL